MRIFVDARMMGAATSRGIGRVIYGLLREFLHDSSIEWIILVRRPEQMEGLPRPTQVVVANVPWYGVGEQAVLPWLIWRSRADLVLFPHWNVPLLSRTPFVCFIHDLILFRHPQSARIFLRHPWFARVKARIQRLVLRFVMARAQTLLVPTQQVAEEIGHFFPASTEKIAVVGEGVDVPASVTPPFPFAGRYFLAVGSAYPHKRLDLVLQAWKSLADAFPDHSLVLVGEMEGFRERLVRMARESALARVFFPGAVTDTALAGWYAHADLLLFPSAAEGFGLPPLEALSYGCPVLASDLPVLYEVLPAAGVRFFRNGDLGDMMGTWKEAVRDLPRLRAEVASVIPEVFARHSWIEAARRVRSFLRCA